MSNSTMKDVKGHNPLPDGLFIDHSPIHGVGVFANKPIPANHDFGITHVADDRFPNGYVRTPLGGLTNHSFTPNCKVLEDGDTFHFATIRDIQRGEELTVDYRPWYSEETLADYK